MSFDNIHQVMDLVYIAGVAVWLLTCAVVSLRVFDSDGSMVMSDKLIMVLRKLKTLAFLLILFSCIYISLKFSVRL